MDVQSSYRIRRVSPGLLLGRVGDRACRRSPSAVVEEWLGTWSLDPGVRHQLRPLVVRLACSGAAPDVECQRRWLVSDWLVRSCLPRWLAEASLHPAADAMAGLAPLRSATDLESVTGLARAARRSARVKEQAAHDVAVDVVGRAAPAGAWNRYEAAVEAARSAHVVPPVAAAVRAGVTAGRDLWGVVADTIADASASIAWQAPFAWAAAGDPPVALVAQASCCAVGRPVRDVRLSAHHLTERLLDLSPGCGRAAQRGSAGR